MTKKDYIQAAKIFYALKPRDAAQECMVDGTIRKFADWFQEDNPQFDRDRFLKACRGEDYNTPGSNK